VQVEADERKSVDNYCKQHKIHEMVEELVEGLLRDRPETKPKEHFAHLLRMQILKEQSAGETTDFDIREASNCSEVPGRLLVQLFESTKKIMAEIVPKETINIILTETIRLLQADRVSIFVYDKRIDMLVLNASNLEQPIRVKPGQGIAGHTFKTHEVINIPDCYKDVRFDQNFDKQTGYVTRNLMTMPIVDFEGECMGVLQAINKKTGDYFSHVDEILLENLTEHVSIALRNAEVYRAAIVTSERATALLDMIQCLSQDLGVQSMILTVTTHASELVQADRCTVFILDEKKQQLWSVSTDSGKEIRIPKTAGIAGECATEGKLILIPDAYKDPRFNQEVDRKSGYRTVSIMAVPVLKRSSSVCGGSFQTLAVIQMINKTEFDGEVGKFDEEDVQVMETFATFVASKLEQSSMLSHETSAPGCASEAGKAFDLDTASSGFAKHDHKAYEASHRGMKIEESFEEGDEEEL